MQYIGKRLEKESSTMIKRKPLSQKVATNWTPLRRWSVGWVAMSFMAAAILSPAYAVPDNSRLKKVLAFHVALGFSHDQGFKEGRILLDNLAAQNGFQITHTTTQADLRLAYLKGFDVVVFNNVTLPEKLLPEQKKAFEDYLNQGGGYVGIHGAGDVKSPQDWQWYMDMLGYTKFAGHAPGDSEPEVSVNQVFKDHTVVAGFPAKFRIKDEVYGFIGTPVGKPGVEILLTVDEKTYEAGAGSMSGVHPMAWTRKQGDGRYFYTAFGHGANAMKHALFPKLIYGGLLYAAGFEPPSALIHNNQSGSHQLGTQKGLSISILSEGKHEVLLFGIKGELVEKKVGNGPRDYNLASEGRLGIHVVKVITPKKTYSERILLQ